jgi:phosphoserine phosphatase RsbU/P
VPTQVDVVVQDQLIERRRRIETVLSHSADPTLKDLLHEVDAALSRYERGTFGLCETCHEPIEADRLLADPLTRFCLDHLSSNEQRALEKDLALASQIQGNLLPPRTLRQDGWQLAYQYHPAGVVSGDYCDVVPADGSLYVMMGDVSGKGVAASMLMAHLHAMFRTLIPIGLPLDQMVARASRVFCESTLPTHYATLVCVRAHPSGEIEVCNAGHPAPIVIGDAEARAIGATGLPLGMFCGQDFSCARVWIGPGEGLVLYTDGVTEAQNAEGVEFGSARLQSTACGLRPRDADLIASQCLDALWTFVGRSRQTDDIALMALTRP